MSASDEAVTAAGLLLVVMALREVFHTLLHPSGIGQLTPAIFRTVWRAARRIGGRASALAGPLALVSSIVVWTLMVLLGCALVYWPQMPHAFHVAQGIQASEQDDLLDAVYVSGSPCRRWGSATSSPNRPRCGSYSSSKRSSALRC